MNQEKDKKIKDILEDLYLIDENFRTYEKELKILIERILALKPNVQFDGQFKEDLKTKLLAKIAQIKEKKKAQSFNLKNLFVSSKYSFALGALMLLIVAIVPTVYLIFWQRGMPPDESLPQKSFDEALPALPAEERASGLANPASVYCEEQNGVVENRTIKAGTKGFCIFEDSSECAQWDFFRGDCEPGHKFCHEWCGDGICNEVVCTAAGCPCAETPDSCPDDCQ